MSTQTLNDKLILLVKVSRIPGWCFGPILYTIGTIHSHKIPKTISSILRITPQILCFSFPLCIIVFGVNDVYDYESDLRNPRKQESMEGGVLNPAHHPFVLSAARVATLLIFLCSFLPLTSSRNHWQGPLLTTLLLVLSWQYSSPPLRLKEKPLLDSISNGAIVWLCWARGYADSGLPLFGPDVVDSATKGWLLAFCTAGVHALGAAADVEADTAAGQRTIATVFGKRLSAAFSAILYLLASTTVEPASFVGIYSFVGATMSLVPVIKPDLAHRTFQGIVGVSVIGATGWIGGKVLGVVKGKGLD